MKKEKLTTATGEPTADDGWKFTERVYEVRYHDTTPLAGSASNAAGTAFNPPAEGVALWH
jgi:hypothetical protein